jgi:hypothetical protein
LIQRRPKGVAVTLLDSEFDGFEALRQLGG